eukprot:14974199-Alexandrium_andersonii.AAC.1
MLLQARLECPKPPFSLVAVRQAPPARLYQAARGSDDHAGPLWGSVGPPKQPKTACRCARQD